MLAIIKTALRIASSAFDTEIQLYIDSCLAEMQGLGIATATSSTTDPQIKETVIAYCKWKFGNNEDKADWERIYHTKLAQLKTMTGYTDWQA